MASQKSRMKFTLEIECDGPLQMADVESLESHVLLAVAERSRMIGGLDAGPEGAGPQVTKVVISHERSGMFRKSVAFDGDGEAIPAEERRGEPRDIGRESD